MGELILLDQHRERRRPTPPAERLDRAVARLDGLVQGLPTRLAPTLERELRGIADAVAGGDPAVAAERAERLVGLLEHPAASGS
jgi:hypothetical protein